MSFFFFIEVERVQENKKSSASGSVKQHEDSLTIICYDCEELVSQCCMQKDHIDHKYAYLSKISLDAMTNLCLTQANITAAVDPAKCTVDLTAPAEVGKPYVGTLTTRLSNGKPNNRKCKATCHIKSLYDGVTTDCAIDKDEPGRYSIQYTPTVRGCHELTVSINDQHVAGSPFPVYVSINPTQLGKPVKIWTGVGSPIYITANSKGDIFVSMLDGTADIIKCDAKGTISGLVEKGSLSHPGSMACDDEDNIYCIDEDSEKVLKCKSNGESVDIRKVQFDIYDSGRSALAIADQKLFIGGTRVITVYDKQLQQVQPLVIIKHRNMVVRDISVGDDKNLYVVDHKNACIQIFTSNGVHLRSIGHDVSPCSVCAHGQYVYIVSMVRARVHVFTSDGHYVVSLGKKGRENGDFASPTDICIDSNGFVYIPDMTNNSVQCF